MTYATVVEVGRWSDATPAETEPAPADPREWTHRPGEKGTAWCGRPAKLDRIGGGPWTCPECRR